MEQTVKEQKLRNWYWAHGKRMFFILKLVLGVVILFFLFANEWVVVTFATKVEVRNGESGQYVEVSKEDRDLAKSWFANKQSISYDTHTCQVLDGSIRFSFGFLSQTYEQRCSGLIKAFQLFPAGIDLPGTASVYGLLAKYSSPEGSVDDEYYAWPSIPSTPSSAASPS